MVVVGFLEDYDTMIRPLFLMSHPILIFSLFSNTSMPYPTIFGSVVIGIYHTITLLEICQVHLEL